MHRKRHRITSALLLGEIPFQAFMSIRKSAVCPSCNVCATTATYLWGEHFNQLIQKPELGHCMVKSLPTVVHTGL